MGDDWVLEVEVTTNRPDCLSHYGVARELATLYRKPLKRLEVTVKESAAPVQQERRPSKLPIPICARGIAGG